MEEENWLHTKDCKMKLDSGEPKKPTDSNVILARKFRWTIEGEKLEPHFVKSVQFDWINKQIELQIFEVILPNKTEPAVVWKEHIEHNTEQLTFRTYDGCGNVLYKHLFHTVYLGGIAPQKFDYSDEDVSFLTFLLQYEKCERISAQEADEENSSENSSSK